MSKEVQRIIKLIIEERGKGDAFMISATKARLALQGIDPDKYLNSNDDDPIILGKLKNIAKQFKISV